MKTKNIKIFFMICFLSFTQSVFASGAGKEEKKDLTKLDKEAKSQERKEIRNIVERDRAKREKIRKSIPEKFK